MAPVFPLKKETKSSIFCDYRDGQVILPQGSNQQAMGFVIDGEVEVYQKTLDGEETILDVLGPNDSFGVHSLFEEIPRPSGIRARGRARVALMGAREYIRLTHETPHLTFQILKSISRRLKELSEELKQKNCKVEPSVKV